MRSELAKQLSYRRPCQLSPSAELSGRMSVFSAQGRRVNGLHSSATPAQQARRWRFCPSCFLRLSA